MDKINSNESLLGIPIDQKRCKDCGEFKSFSCFATFLGDGKRYRRSRCVKCYNAALRRWQHENRKKRHDTYRRSHLSQYGISVRQYFAMVEEQGGMCAICKGPPTQLANSVAKLCVDHDHLTGKVRGLLCAKCNWLIGAAKESEQILLASIEYLKKHT